MRVVRGDSAASRDNQRQASTRRRSHAWQHPVTESPPQLKKDSCAEPDESMRSPKLESVVRVTFVLKAQADSIPVPKGPFCVSG